MSEASDPPDPPISQPQTDHREGDAYKKQWFTGKLVAVFAHCDDVDIPIPADFKLWEV